MLQSKRRFYRFRSSTWTQKKKKSRLPKFCKYKAQLIVTTIRQGCIKREIRHGTLHLLFYEKISVSSVSVSEYSGSILYRYKTKRINS